MRSLFAGVLLLAALPCGLAAQPADCPREPSTGPTLPLSLDLAGLPGLPPGVTGYAYVEVPLEAPGIACQDPTPPPQNTTVVLPPGSTVVCPNGSQPPC